MRSIRIASAVVAVLLATGPAAPLAPAEDGLEERPPVGPFRPGLDGLSSPAVRQTDRVRAELLASQDAVRPGDRLHLAVHFKFLQPHLHLYGNDLSSDAGTPTRIVPLEPKSFRFARPTYPPGRKMELFGLKLTQYDGDFAVFVSVAAPQDLAHNEVTFVVAAIYQVCSDQACFEGYDEQTPPLKLTLPVRPAGAAVAQTHPEVFSRLAGGPLTTQPGSTAGEIATGPHPPARLKPASAGEGPQGAPPGETRSIWNIKLASGDWLLALLVSLLVGLALNLTPCVLPIIPLTVGYFVYQSQQAGAGGGGSRRRILLAGLAFTCGLVATFAALGVVVVLAGGQLQMVFAYQEAVLALGLFIVVMALGMFGVYPVQLPAFVGRFSAGRAGLGGAAVMGVLAAVLSTPCTGPFLGSIIAWALGAPAALGLAVFVGVGLGMAAPYLLLAAAPGLLENVPRSGRWTELVKIGLGFVLLGLALSVLNGLRSQEARWQFALWSAVALAAAVWFASQVIRSRRASAGWVWPARLILLGAAVWGVAHWWPAEKLVHIDASGAPSAKSGLIAGQTHTVGRTVWYDFDSGILKRARDAQLPVLLDLVSDNCTNCRIMAERVWPTEQAEQALRGIVPIQANISRSDARPLPGRFNTLGTPALVVLDRKGNVVETFSPVEFYADPDGFAAAMKPLQARFRAGETGVRDWQCHDPWRAAVMPRPRTFARDGGRREPG